MKAFQHSHFGEAGDGVEAFCRSPPIRGERAGSDGIDDSREIAGFSYPYTNRKHKYTWGILGNKYWET